MKNPPAAPKIQGRNGITLPPHCSLPAVTGGINGSLSARMQKRENTESEIMG